jgi:uncharacterized membrane protein
LNYLTKDDVVILGMLMVILGIVFKTSSSKRPGFVKFYKVIPPLLLCYFLPSFLTTFHIADTGNSNLYNIASGYLLPAALVLVTMSINLKEILRLGPKSLIMFLAGSFGIVIGGPLAMIILHFFSPGTIGGTGADSVWRGLATIAGSWIGGAANQTALYQIFKPSPGLFSTVITIDIVVSQIWMALLLLGAAKSKQIDRLFKADSRHLEDLKSRMDSLSARSAHVTTLTDLMVILGVAFGLTALAKVSGVAIAMFFTNHFPSLDRLSFTSDFFWLIVLATLFGIIISFTSLRNYEGAGSSRIGSFFIYFLVATIGLKMNLFRVFDYPGLFLLGVIWICIHALLMIVVGKIIKAPFFFLAVGSQANIGGVASAPIVAAAFNPSLAPVGVLLAVLGYAIGTYGGWLSAILMQWIFGLLHM